jgi:hypothetical protein
MRSKNLLPENAIELSRMNKPIFRQAALERLSSPEQLDQLVRVTRPVGWLALLALSLVILSAIAWGIVGRLPVQVAGPGILISTGGIHDVVSPGSGQVVDLLGEAGDVIQAGQVIASIAGQSLAFAPVRSPYAGRIVELKVDNGSQVERGTPLLSVEGLDPGGRVDVVAIIYTAPAEGKKIRPGMEVQVSPSTVRREEYGFMLGQVASVGQFPATPQGMLRVLGNPELVKTLSAASSPIEVRVTLSTDEKTTSGYAWSSQAGPPIRIDSGTLCNAWITLDLRRPISLVLPIFK